MKLETRILELENVRDKAIKDYQQLPDDGSEFPHFTPMKNLKISFLNLAIMSDKMLGQLNQIQETGTVV